MRIFTPLLPSGQRPFWMMVCVSLVSIFASVNRCLAQNPHVLTNLAQIHGLSLKDGSNGIPINVRATITYTDPSWQMLFVQDGTAGGYVECNVPGSDPIWTYQAGEVIDIDGFTSPGPIKCNIRQRNVRPVGAGALPKSIAINDATPENSDLDARLVTMQGVITGAKSQGRKIDFAFRAPGIQNVHLMVAQGNPITAETLIGAVSDVTGVYGLELDASNHPTGGHVLWITDMAGIQKVRSLPVSLIASLSSSSTNAISNALIRISGNIISQSPGEFLFVHDDSGSIRVNYSSNALFTVGSPVEVYGSVAVQGAVQVLTDATIVPGAAKIEVATSTNGPVESDGPDNNLPTLTQAMQIRNLSANDAAKGYPVRLVGIITYCNPSNDTQFVQDRTGGVYINPGHKKFDRFPDAGQLVEITGFTGPGDFAPVLEGENLKLRGAGTLPKPKSVSTQTLMSGSQDSQWIVLNGVVRHQAVEDGDTVLSLATEDSVIPVNFPNAVDHPAARSYVDSWVEIRGVCGTVFDSHRHLQGIRLYSPNWDQIRTWSDGPDNPFTLPVRSISELLEFHPAADGIHRSHVRGVVLLRRSDGSFYLQDNTGAILIQPESTRGLIEPGQIVELVGFPSVLDKWPVLQDAEVRAVGEKSNLQPLQVTAQTPLSSALHGSLVRLEARVISHSSSASEESVTLQFGPLITDAILQKSQNEGLLGELNPGSVVELTGIYLARVDDNQKVQSFQIQLRSASDMRLISTPSFWSAQRALWLFGALAIAFGLALAWVTLLRKKVNERTRELRAEIEERKRMEEEMAKTHKELLIASRGAGMAEVATSVLHNVGNVLNSVNVSANLIVEATKSADLNGLVRVSALVREHANNLPTFLGENPKGRQLPKYLELLAERHQTGQKTVLAELESLTKNINHINDIVSMQQNYAKAVGVTEIVSVASLVEDALQMNHNALARHDITVQREYQPGIPDITLDKHKALQILVNLISNARLACQETNRADKCVTARISRRDNRVCITIADNGVGIAPENMTRIFSHGFTTRKTGHGFGLHSGAIAAKDLGGALKVHSNGSGKGAEFTLELPLLVQSEKRATRPIPLEPLNGLIHAAAT